MTAEHADQKDSLWFPAEPDAEYVRRFNDEYALIGNTVGSNAARGWALTAVATGWIQPRSNWGKLQHAEVVTSERQLVTGTVFALLRVAFPERMFGEDNLPVPTLILEQFMTQPIDKSSKYTTPEDLEGIDPVWLRCDQIVDRQYWLRRVT